MTLSTTSETRDSRRIDVRLYKMQVICGRRRMFKDLLLLIGCDGVDAVDICILIIFIGY